MMDAAGLQRILGLCHDFGFAGIEIQLKNLQASLAEDERKLRERLDEAILKNLNDPQDVYNAISAKTDGTKAKDYFLSMMQHLLLIREEGQPMVHYYQLLDSIVTDVVLDKKLAGAEQRMGHSVERIIAQFNESDRYQAAEDEAAEARAMAMRLKLEKEVLEEEIAQGQEGLIGRLKAQITQMEEKLKVSRETTSRLQGQLQTQKAGYEEQISQLEAQIMELFRMLKEVGKGVDTILDGGTMDRKTLVEKLERNFQRHKTISILEGRNGRSQRKKKSGDQGEDEEEDVEATPGKSSLRKKPAALGSVKTSLPNTQGSGKVIVDENGRVSQFMDAEEADAQEQIQQQLVAGAKLVSTNSFFGHRLLSLSTSTHPNLAGPALGVSEGPRDVLIARLWAETSLNPTPCSLLGLMMVQ